MKVNAPSYQKLDQEKLQINNTYLDEYRTYKSITERFSEYLTFYFVSVINSAE